MSEKRFVLCKKGDVDYIEDNCCVQLSGFDVLCEMLNEQQITIEELQQKYNKLCIEIANIYSKYIFMKEFSEDTNPNEAVKYVLRELMQKTKEVR